MIKNYSFENYIVQCCKTREWNLRKFLKSKLISNGFQINEDDYTSFRSGKYGQVHNMLAIRGKNPRVCLVAHTDVCRDHGFDSNEAPNVNPVIKSISLDGEMKTIIQDKNCETQVGGDDRLGVAINSWLALNTGYDLGLLFTTDEEVGAISAGYAHFPELLDFDILLQVDRGNRSNQLVTSIGGIELCSYAAAQRLIKISEDIGNPRCEVDGLLTDVLAIKTNNMCKDAVNMTCGYHNSIGAQKDEYISIQESKDTMKYVSSIVQYYYLQQDDQEIENTVEGFSESIEYSNKDRSNLLRGRAVNSRKGRAYFDEDLFSEDRYNQDKHLTDEERYDNYWREI
jgi:hypothetical protein